MECEGEWRDLSLWGEEVYAKTMIVKCALKLELELLFGNPTYDPEE